MIASNARFLTRFLASPSACPHEGWLLGSGRGRADLHQVQAAGAELGGAAEKVELPHAVEGVAVTVAQAGPGALEVAPPGHQGAVVVLADVVHVLDDKQI